MRQIRMMLALLLMACFASQVSAYKPMLREGKQWFYYMPAGGKMVNGKPVPNFYPVVYTLDGDTVINGVTYMRLVEDECYPDLRTNTVSRTVKVVAYVRESIQEGFDYGPTTADASAVYARRAGSHKPLRGDFRTCDDFGAEYMVYLFNFQGQQEFIRLIPTTGPERECLFNYQSGTPEVEVFEGEERMVWHTDNPFRQLVEGVGYMITNTGPATNLYVRNFIDLEAYHDAYTRVLSHVVEDGRIIFRSDLYDLIMSNAYDPEAPGGDPEDGVGVDDVPVRQAVVDGVTYDLQGRRVADTDTPGIYIRDGRKVAVTR
ncbi:MAG: hypothetical protein IKR25_07310 [Muribaculaceae bacterium]|nr:hypothetical protein [Muribaculaceae bacterium]